MHTHTHARVDVYKRQVLYIQTQCSQHTRHTIARSLVKPDETGNVPIRVANILDQAITLQSNTLLGKLTPVALSLIHI